MKEQVAIMLYEDASVPTCCRDRRYEPDDMKGWSVERGETIPLTEDGGGRLFAVVDHVEEQVHRDEDGRRYKIATVWTQD
jgi:hypothetical protein